MPAGRGQLADDGVVLGHLLLGDRHRSSRLDGEGVGEPVRAADEHEADGQADGGAGSAPDAAADEHEEAAEAGEQDGRLEDVLHRAFVSRGAVAGAGAEENGSGHTQVPVLDTSSRTVDPVPGSIRRPVVVYVEDEAAVRRLVEYWLDHAGFDVVLAADGTEGLAAIRRVRPDLVITDAMMPGITGDELVAILTEDPELSSIPIIMATAAASRLRVQRMMERGCFAVLAKPLDEESFVTMARAALET